MKPDAGVALDGRYLLKSLIAVGGMGEVWVAHDQSLARDVAAKVLREEFAGDDGFIERFRTEARNSARLSHPNIAQLFDYGEQAGSAYLVMELVAGEPLSDVLTREQILPPSRVLPILAQTARALHAAHVAGVVHRDVKPGNILVSREGRVKITDFGISLASNQMSMTASGMVMGTAQYLAPEQALGKAAAPASDLYSLGVVAYEALVGRRPFTGPTAVDIAVAHVNRTVPPIPESVPEEIAALVMRLLSKDPEQRPRSAASLARTLDEMLGATPAVGIPVALARGVAAAAAGSSSYAGRHAGPANRVAAHRSTDSSAAGDPVTGQPGNGWAVTAGPGLAAAVGSPDVRNISRRALHSSAGASPAGAGSPTAADPTAGAPTGGSPTGAATQFQDSLSVQGAESASAPPPSYTPGVLPPVRDAAATPKPAPARRPGLLGLWDSWRPVVTSPPAVLVLLVGIALLGALFADRILGSGTPSEPATGAAVSITAGLLAPARDGWMG